MGPQEPGHTARIVDARSVLLSLSLLACEPEPDDPICALTAHISKLEIRIVGYRTAYGDVGHASLSFCIAGASCESASIDALDDVFECRSDSSLNAPERRCELQPDGSLLLTIELLDRPAVLHGVRALTLELLGPGDLDVKGTADVLLKPVEGNGEGCGVTHVLGSVTVDATLHELGTG